MKLAHDRFQLPVWSRFSALWNQQDGVGGPDLQELEPSDELAHNCGAAAVNSLAPISKRLGREDCREGAWSRRLNGTNSQTEARLMRFRPPKWQAGSLLERAPAKPGWLGPLEFLEEQLWGLRDRTDALGAQALPEPVAIHLAAIDDEVSVATLLLRRPTPATRRSVAALVGQLWGMLEAIEAYGWSGQASAVGRHARAAG